MCLDISNAETAEEIANKQLEFIGMQEADKICSSSMKIRCPCLTLRLWKEMHLCLYCGVWLCKSCAEEHFGKTVEAYTSEADLKELLSSALKALCLSEAYDGEMFLFAKDSLSLRPVDDMLIMPTTASLFFDFCCESNERKKGE